MDDASEEIGLYDDLNYVDLGELVSKLENDKEILSNQIKTLEGDVERLVSELTCMKETEKSLSRNISELYKTAKTEIERKDRMINSLRTEKENLIFRRMNRATEERQTNDYGNIKRNAQEAVEENSSKRRKFENESHVTKSESGRHSPKRPGSSNSRDYKDRHSSYSRDNHRHKDSTGGSSRRNRGNESSDRNRNRHHIKGEDSERNVEPLDKNKFKHNSVTKQDSTKVKERGRNENAEEFGKHGSESVSSERKSKHNSSHKNSTEKENDKSKVNDPNNTNAPSKSLQSSTKTLTNDASSKPVDCDNSSHLKNVPKVEDKSNVDKKKSYPMKPFCFFDKTLSPPEDEILSSLPQAMDCENQLNSKIVEEPQGDKINSLSVDKPPKSNPIKENKILISPRHDNLMNYLEIQPKKETNTALSKNEKLATDDCEKKLKSKTLTKKKSGSSKEEKVKSKTEKKRSATTSKASDGKNRSEKENKSDSNTDKATAKHDKARLKNHDKSSIRKQEPKEKRKSRVKVNGESGSAENEDPVNLNILCKERERIKRDLLALCDSEEDDNHSGEETSSLEPDDAKVTFLANVHISPVIKAKKGATDRLQECIVKLGERENNANNVVISNKNPEQDNKIVPTKSENPMEVTSSCTDDSIGSPTSSSNQIEPKRTIRLENLIGKLSGKEQNCSRYDVFEESVNEVAHSTLKINDCQLSSTNTTINEENAFAQPGTSAMNNVKPQLPSLEATNNSAGVNLVRSLETSNTNITNNNSIVLKKSKTNNVDSNISSSSEHLNNSNSTIVLNSSLSLNNSSESSSSVRTVFKNRRRRCVVKIVN